MTSSSMLNNPNVMLVIGALLGIGNVIFFILMFLGCVLFSLMVVAYSMIFVKADRPSWNSVIPFYNFYVLFDFIMGKGWLGLVYSLLPLSFIFVQGQIYFILNLITFMLYIILNIKLAKCFEKEIWFGIGLLFLPFIFYPILAFGDAKYER